MGKSLKDYKREEIKCVVVEDFETGKVFRICEKEGIKNALKKYSKKEITKVLNPTQEQRKEILGLLQIEENNNTVSTSISKYDTLTKMIPMLTDIKVDKNYMKIIDNIIEDPDQVFTYVINELNGILLDVNLEWIENLRIIGKIPAEMVDLISQKGELNGQI